MTESPFRRLLVVSATPEPDLELLRYAAMLGSYAQQPELVVATPAAEEALRCLAPSSRWALAARPDTALSFRVMLEPHLDLVFDMAEEAQCDLIVARHPRGFEHAKTLLNQLLFDAPCAVCLVPNRTRTDLRRPMVRIEPTAKGAQLLALAAAFSKAASSEELIAVHTYFRYGLDSETESLEELREQRTMELYRFLARTPLGGMNCTPVLEESPNQSGALLRLAAERASDLLIVDPDADRAPLWQWNHRESEALARSAEIPVLAVRVGPRKGLMGVLREQVFCGMEPIFS